MLQINFDCSTPSGLQSINSYSRLFGHSRNWCRTRIRQYMDTQDALKLKEKDCRMDRDRTSTGQASDRHRTPSERQRQIQETEEEKKESAAIAAPPPIQSGNGKAKRIKKPCQSPFPEPFPSELRETLEAWASTHGFSSPQLSHAIEVVGDWAVSGGKLKADWGRTIQGAMRRGWALETRPETHEQMLLRISREMEAENGKP